MMDHSILTMEEEERYGIAVQRIMICLIRFKIYNNVGIVDEAVLSSTAYVARGEFNNTSY
jgi:hypothetical protein